MKDALNGLTSRGRTLVAAGATAFLLAVLLEQTDIMRVGLLVAVLPLASAFSVSRTRFRLASRRTIEPGRVRIGGEAVVALELQNVSALPTGLLLVEDHLPVGLGTRPRFVIDRMAPKGTRTARYPVRSEARGRFAIGPLTVRLTDPFGFCELDRSFSSQQHLIVTPVVEPLSPLPLRGDWSGTGDSRARSVAAAGEDDVAVREYRHGDELRRVHWRATAKNGSLMVRREEQPWESRCTVLLDTRATAFPGTGPDSSFEKAASAAASVVVHLNRRGFAVRLQTGTTPVITGTPIDDVSGGGSDAEGLLLDALSTVKPDRSLSLETLATTVRHGNEGMLIAVLGEISSDDTDRLIRARHGMGQSVALVCDPSGWVSPNHRGANASTRRDDCLALLRAAGWWVGSIERARSIEQSWSDVRHLGYSQASASPS